MRKLEAQHIKNDVVKKLAVGESQISIGRQVLTNLLSHDLPMRTKIYN